MSASEGPNSAPGRRRDVWNCSPCCCSVFLGLVDKEVDQVPHFDVAFERVSEVGVGLEIVSVSSPDLLMGYIASLFQFGDDPLGGLVL